ncbi:MAG: 2,3-bisphosphoglycerate-independent phosphoglycerate mutase [Rhodospirillales bacterium]
MASTSSGAQNRPRPVVLCVLDGWGHRAERENNAIRQARTPTYDRWLKTQPHGLLDASELAVGLPQGQVGNSEVGHMNLGAGRVLMQELPLIDRAIADGSLGRNPRLGDFISALKQSGGACHLLGLLSPGGVHSHQDQIAAIARILADAGLKVWVHALLDGRDTLPKQAHEHLAKFLADIAPAGNAALATVGGRYFAMDRDKRWERVAAAYRCMVMAEAPRRGDAVKAVLESHRAGKTDEFVQPFALGGYAGMRDGDGLFCANFRADRARQMLAALLDPAFDGFARPRVVRFAGALGLVEYSAALNKFMGALFPQRRLANILGELVAGAGMRQLRIAETEKYAHVTFFFNGGEEAAFPGEERILVPSPRVATYDLKPEMSAFEVTDRLVAAIGSGRFDLVVVNYANTDMVGHTGNLAAAIKAVEAVDLCLGRLEAAVTKAGGTMLVTADHGNAELMHDGSTGQPHTAHTMSLVPAILVNGPAGVKRIDGGRLADVAPTLLQLLGLKQPAEMTGRSLLAADQARAIA